MSNYSNYPQDCRVDFFKPSGEWESTSQVRFRQEDWKKTHMKIALENALEDSGLLDMLIDFNVICLFPYHEHSHPIWIEKNK